ncbi:hypothetical protein A8E62_37945 [Burkholderia cenocepacia]|nr:hypothetical protein A8E62_37945 [Burkholderia cenocepacia]
MLLQDHAQQQQGELAAMPQRYARAPGIEGGQARRPQGQGVEPDLDRCHGAALWSQCGVGIRAPLEGRHIGASPRAA